MAKDTVLWPNSPAGFPGKVSLEGDYGVEAARISGKGLAWQWGCEDMASAEVSVALPALETSHTLAEGHTLPFTLNSQILALQTHSWLPQHSCCVLISRWGGAVTGPGERRKKPLISSMHTLLPSRVPASSVCAPPPHVILGPWKEWDSGPALRVLGNEDTNLQARIEQYVVTAHFLLWSGLHSSWSQPTLLPYLPRHSSLAGLSPPFSVA